MGGLTFEKLLLIGIIAVFIFGPERLPTLATQLANLIKRARAWTEDAKTRVSEELGDDFSSEDWRKLDPRQYDPRRIIRDAWNDADPKAAAAGAMAGSAAGAAGGGVAGAGAGAGVGAGASAGGAGGAAAMAGGAVAMGAAAAGAGGSAPAWATNTVATTRMQPGHAPFDTEAT